MEEKLGQKIEEQNVKIDLLVQKVDKLYKSFMIVIWVTVGLFVVPLIAAAFIIPKVLSTYLGAFGGLL